MSSHVFGFSSLKQIQLSTQLELASLKLFFILFLFSSINGYSQGITQSLHNRKHPSDSSKFPEAEVYVIEHIIIEGNKVTKPAIILRELSFKEGDTLVVDSTEFKDILLKCKNNVINTSLFTVVFLTYKKNPNNGVEINIKVEERLYTWPTPVFENADRNFNVWWQSKNFSRLNYGLYVTRYNFRGRNETVSLNLQTGYTKNFTLSYSVPYISKQKNLGMGFSIKFSENNEFPFETESNKLVFYKNNVDVIRKIFQTGIKFSYRDGIYYTHRSSLNYNTVWISDTIFKLNPNYLNNGTNKQTYIAMDYQFDMDYRNVKAYPLKGYYFGFVVGTYQTGIKTNFNTSYLVSAFNKYNQLFERIYFGASIKGKLSSPGAQAYFNQRALGYGNDLVRGYAYYVVDGQNYGLLKTNLKYELVKPRIIKANFIPFDKFKTIPFAIYFNIFGDAGYVNDKYTFQNNNLANTLLYGSGIGIDYVTYYDMVLRIEYSINKFGETGFFLNFNATL